MGRSSSRFLSWVDGFSKETHGDGLSSSSRGSGLVWDGVFADVIMTRGGRDGLGRALNLKTRVLRMTLTLGEAAVW